jgi:RNA polymerase sigma-70 factor, ECF subfamily
MLPEEVTSVLVEERVSLTSYFLGVTSDFHFAEDVYQEVCVKAMSSGPEFENRSQLVAWAKTVGRNRSIDLVRLKANQRRGLSEATLQLLADEWGDSEHMSTMQDALIECFTELGPKSHIVLRLRYFDRKSIDDVTVTLGRKKKAVYQMLMRIHKTLGECIRRRMNAGELG